MQIDELLIRQYNNEKIAIKYSNKIITYKQWYKKSKNLEKIILDIIQEKSKTVAIFLPNSIEYAVAYFGISFSKKVIVPIDPQSKGPEICSTVKYCEIDLIISNSKYKLLFKETFKDYLNKIVIYFIDSQEKIEYGKSSCLEKSIESNQDMDLEDVAIMLHTSGTTSDPKRVMLTSRNLLCNIESNIKSLNLSNEDIGLIALPMFFGYCNTAQFLSHIYVGATMVIMDNVFLPKQFFKIVQDEKITNFTGVPTMLIMLLNYEYSNNYDFSTLRYICFGGGVMPVEKLKQLIYKYPTIGFIHTYGQTECSPRITALLPQDSMKKIGSIGKSIPGVKVKIVDINNNPVEPLKNGEIVVCGDNVMKGYYKQREKTTAIIRNGWLHTGDMGYFDEDGYIYLTGRIKNIIISGGINIYPEEIEQVLLQNECIEDAYVYGKAHDMMGEVPVAKIIKKSEITSKNLRQYCRKYLADYKVPYDFEFVDKLKKTYNGKVKRGE